MPELPEVETTRRGIAAHILAERIIRISVRDSRLRWPVPTNLNKIISGQHVRKIDRRGKYLLLYTDRNCLIIHLGMSGSLRVIKNYSRPEKHDHIDIVFESGTILRYRDPRRFGSFHLVQGDPNNHKLLASLGPEPLSENFTSDHLFQKSRGKKQAVKNFIMDSKIVVGAGNIYANEALFASGISPKKQAGRVSKASYGKLVPAIKSILSQAITAGGTTLRDFVSGEGDPGYFSQDLKVYGRAGQPCLQCDKPIKLVRLSQRSSYYCSHCQK